MTLDGQVIRLSDFRGQPVIVWFMASWCSSCIYAANFIHKAVKGYDNVVVIMVDLWSEEYLKRLGLLGKPGYPPPDRPEDLRKFHKAFAGEDWIPVMDDGRLVKLSELST